MEEHIGKICPFCKTEIKEDDTVKICPACGIPHHQSCWEENRGCTTFGCSEQHYEPQDNGTAESSVADSIEQYNSAIQSKKPKKKSTKIVVIAASALIIIIIGILGFQTYQKNALHNRLKSADWLSFEDDTILYLEFSDDEIEYSGYFGILGKVNIATLDYKVISGSKIEVRGSEIDVELDDDSVVFRPSFINSKSYSLWLED